MKAHSYTNVFIRLTVLLGVVVSLMVLCCLVIGAQSPGDTISAFTTTSVETTDVWVMDISRMKYVRLQVKGQQDNIPVWSTQERRLVYFPRTP